MNAPALAVRILVLGFITAFSVIAGAEVLDDSLSPRQQFRLQLTWADESGEVTADQQMGVDGPGEMIGTLADVDVRLKTEDYMGEKVRIYLSLPRITDGAPADSNLRLAWATEGIFLNGEVHSGTRGLLFEGQVDEPVMREIFDFSIYFSAWFMDDALRITPVYEIEVQ